MLTGLTLIAFRFQNGSKRYNLITKCLPLLIIGDNSVIMTVKYTGVPDGKEMCI